MRGAALCLRLDYIGSISAIADGMSIARVGVCRHSKTNASEVLGGGHFEYRHAPTRAMGMPSAMPIRSYGGM